MNEYPDETLRAALAALPREISPPPHVLERVHARIDALPIRLTGRAPWHARPLMLAAAAVLLVALSSTVTTALLTRGQSLPIPSFDMTTSDPATSLVAVHALERTYEDAIAELQRVVAEQRHDIAPETLRVLRANLDLIDRAVAEARTALQADPSNGALTELLRSGYERKLDVLRSVSTHARGQS